MSDEELQALLDSMKESMEWEQEQLRMEGNKWDKRI
ncbi:MAG: hypothetical protein JWM44_2315 [Bacilli bacterium]|nr:hypothetical protein [Bacilli bacterium]